MMRSLAIFALLCACMLPSAQLIPAPLVAWAIGLGVPAVLAALYHVATRP